MPLIIGHESHLDHGLSTEQLSWLLKQCSGWEGFHTYTFDLPVELGVLPCGLYGPAMGDEPVSESEVIYDFRGEREYKSRLVNRHPRPTRKATVIAGPYDGHPCYLYTVFGGPLAPKEPDDPTLDPNGRSESQLFWSQHALARP